MPINKKIAVAVRTTIADRLPEQIRTSAFTHTALTVDEWWQMLAAHRAVPGAFPALCRAHVRLNDVPVSLRPSLPGLRGRAAQDDAGPDGEREVRRWRCRRASGLWGGYVRERMRRGQPKKVLLVVKLPLEHLRSLLRHPPKHDARPAHWTSDWRGRGRHRRRRSLSRRHDRSHFICVHRQVRLDASTSRILTARLPRLPSTNPPPIIKLWHGSRGSDSYPCIPRTGHRPREN